MNIDFSLPKLDDKISQIMAFDFGTKNIGVAIGQRVTGTSSPLPTIRAQEGIPNWQMLGKLIEEWQPDAFLVGIPLNMDGSVGEIGLRARKFANRLHGRFGKPWYPADERLSTRSAKEKAEDLGHRGNYQERPVDSLAALVLLEEWLAQLAAQENL
ncbi:Holliday junction resolvase RuvX [Spartinivicinus ruber]|uniref:Holliday junction resolvase RuvX n=1 Tax=Spartinivicinus ruber TaxID=2683272 RepID=UPI001E50DBFF|nr:Holliday junction resolvase RuvX [Spartinivicinus ruber]